MAKREFIERENLINELAESSKYHAQTSREESLLYRDRQIVREQPTITEQDIVKPVLDKMRAEIKTMSGDIETIADALQIIDKYRTESEG